jgi:hypothetical protein
LAIRQSKIEIKADLQKEYDTRFNERRWETYLHFSKIIRKMMEATKAKKLEEIMPEIVADLYQFSGELLLVGSNDVVKSFNKWRANSEPSNKEQQLEMMRSMMGILIEMRKDLGYSARISPDEFLRIFINDFDKYLIDNKLK